MLPRQRGFQQQRGRNNHHQQYAPYGGGGGGGGSNNAANEEGPSSIGPMDRRHFNNRQWKGQNFHPRHQQRRNRFGLEHHQSKDKNSYNISDYFHPSMLEDPWMHFTQKNEREKVEGADSSDAGGGAGGGSSGGGGGGSED
ncbi:RNA-binding protein cabeza-like [Toxorhynchites rutilus septentrionalis]|nr:RNA-binding protein cabeza-like [Toxorhynchites rutilus septentrionalis]